MPRATAWPVAVTTVDDLPRPMGVQLAEQLARDEIVQRLVYVPADFTASRVGQWSRTRGLQVLAFTNQRLIIGVQAVRRGEPPWVAIPYDAVVMWELGAILLYGRLDLCANIGGEAVRTYMEFNTVGANVIAAALAPLEQATLGVTRHGEERQLLPPGIDLPFKFRNFLADALLPGELLHDLVFHEAITTPLLHFWRRLIAPGSIIAGTDRRLLVIREDAKLRGDRYGYSVLTLPRRWAGRLTLDDDGTWLTLVDTAHPGWLRLPIERGRAAALWALVTTLQHASAPSLPEPAIEHAVGTQ